MKQTAQASPKFILASESPRRRDILSALGLTFEVVIPAVEERLPSSARNPVAVAQKQAVSKARAVATNLSEGIVIAADTIVVINSDVLGKPSSGEMARHFLHRLQGKQHQVITALALINTVTKEKLTDHRISQVYMREYDDDEIATYVARGSPLDKAGAYAIQDTQFHPVTKVEGCYLNVVGLPVCTLLRLMERIGIYPKINPDWRPPGNCPDCNYWVNLKLEPRQEA